MEIENLQCDPASLVAIIFIVVASAIFISVGSFDQGVREGELKFYREHDKARN